MNHCGSSLPVSHPSGPFAVGVLIMCDRFCSIRRASLLLAVLVVSPCLPAGTASADSLDWRNVNGKNWLTPVRSQFGGTCWEFSACGALESNYKLTRNDPSFSQCLRAAACLGNGSRYGQHGRRLGLVVFAYYVTHGVVSEAECPHQSSSEDAGIAPYWPLNTGWENRVFKGTTYAIQITSSASQHDEVLTEDLWPAGGRHMGSGHDLYGNPAD